MFRDLGSKGKILLGSRGNLFQGSREHRHPAPHPICGFTGVLNSVKCHKNPFLLLFLVCALPLIYF